MKKLLSCIAVMLCLVLAPVANAKGEKKEKGSDDVVEVTLTDGTVEKGKITKYWDYFLKKGFNKTFVMRTDDGRELKLSSDDVTSLYFPLRDSVEQVTRYIPIMVPQPSLRNKNKMDRLIMAQGAKSDHATLMWYLGWTDVHYGNKVRREKVPTHCIRFENDTVAYPFYYVRNGGFNTAVMKHHLKNSRPELEEFIKQYFKKNKDARKRFNKDVSVMLEAYDEYLKQSDPK